ncbi:MAG: Uncharacterised protein [Crocinitomicaceae bacterium]|nr:MAG: Uncharacterised protein [Crocinitomicaceae bacterium]
MLVAFSGLAVFTFEAAAALFEEGPTGLAPLTGLTLDTTGAGLVDVFPTGLTFGLTFGFILGFASFEETEVGALEDIGVFLLGLPSCAKVAENANKIDVAIINFFILFCFKSYAIYLKSDMFLCVKLQF